MSTTYFEVLNPELEKKGFTPEQIKAINENIVSANNTVNNALKKQQEAIAQKESEDIRALMELGLANIKPISDLFKQGWLKQLLNFLTSFIIVAAVVYLAKEKILGACETSTILGGIVGYLLGKGK